MKLAASNPSVFWTAARIVARGRVRVADRGDSGRSVIPEESVNHTRLLEPDTTTPVISKPSTPSAFTRESSLRRRPAGRVVERLVEIQPNQKSPLVRNASPIRTTACRSQSCWSTDGTPARPVVKLFASSPATFWIARSGPDVTVAHRDGLALHDGRDPPSTAPMNRIYRRRLTETSPPSTITVKASARWPMVPERRRAAGRNSPRPGRPPHGTLADTGFGGGGQCRTGARHFPSVVLHLEAHLPHRPPRT